MTIKIIFKYLPVLFFISFLSSCDDEGSANQTEFGIFRLLDENTVEMDGEITSSTLDDFNELIENYPSVSRINILEVPGSSDDEVNLEVSLKVHQENISTHLTDNGLIASGGVDFFLAGTTRTKGENTQIGVHSWSDGTNDATAFPVGDANHQPYIDYYIAVGFSQEEAEDFYYFTINAAPAADIHWMTEAEIEQYGILKL